MKNINTNRRLVYLTPSIRCITIEITSLMAGSVGLTSVIEFKTLPKANPSEARVKHSMDWSNDDPSLSDEENGWDSSLED